MFLCLNILAVGRFHKNTFLDVEVRGGGTCNIDERTLSEQTNFHELVFQLPNIGSSLRINRHRLEGVDWGFFSTPSWSSVLRIFQHPSWRDVVNIFHHPLEGVGWEFFSTHLKGVNWEFFSTPFEGAEDFSAFCMYVCVLPIPKNVFKYNLLEKKKFRKTKLMTWELIYPDEEHAFRFLDQREADKFRGKKCWVKDNVYWATKGIVIMKPRQQWWGGKYDLSGLLSLS